MTARAALQGKTILVTSPLPHGKVLKSLLAGQGARVILFPLIRILPPSAWKRFDALSQGMPSYDWIAFTSAFGVRYFFRRFRKIGKSVQTLERVRIAAVGPSTAAALKSEGVRPLLVAPKARAASLFDALKKKFKIRGKSFLLPRGDKANPMLPSALRLCGGRVTELTVYRTRRARFRKASLRSLLLSGKTDFVLFTSGSAVRIFFEAAGGHEKFRKGPRFVTIGPETSAALAALGFRVFRRAPEPTPEGVLAAFLNS